MTSQQLEIDKSRIISWVSQLQDYSIVETIVNLMTLKQESILTLEQKNAIDEAIASITANGAISNESVKIETKKRFPHLFKN